MAVLRERQHRNRGDVHSGAGLPELLVLAAGGLQDVGHGHWAAFLWGAEGGGKGNVLDVPAGELELARKFRGVDVRRQGRFLWPDRSPDSEAARLVGEGE